MKKLIKVIFALVGFLACFAPYEFERKENGDFLYKAWLLGISRKTDGEKHKYKVWFFNKPKLTGISFSKRIEAEYPVDDELFTDDVKEDIENGIIDELDGIDDLFSGLE